MMESGVSRSKHALPYAQHLGPMTISSAEGRYGIIEPWDPLSHIIYDDGLLLNFDASSGYLPINL